MNRRRLARTYRSFASFFFDPRLALRKLRALPHFVRNASAYRRANNGGSMFPLRLSELHYASFERYEDAGSARGHYFFQDLWAARDIADRGVTQHVDVGSRVDGFVAHLLPFCAVDYVDIRPFAGEVDGLRFVAGSVLSLPYADASVASLSCLHVIEHIGLGRYGDPVDPNGPAKAAAELARVLDRCGVLLLGVPVGRQRLVFDAHRIFDPDTIAGLFAGLELDGFALIDDAGLRVRRDATFDDARGCEYGCGLFRFRKP